MQSALVDAFHRHYNYLRLSITDLCNFRCNYCLPNGIAPCANTKNAFLDLNEIQRLTLAFAQLGTKKIRITGGEPTLRKDFLTIVESIHQTPGIEQVALTTNGYRLLRDVEKWQKAGIQSINLSLDSLDPKMFYKITGFNRFDEIMQGIDRAFDVGFKKIKVNAVLMKNLNDHEFASFLQWIKFRPIQMRFIELMEMNDHKNFFYQHHLSGHFLMEKLINQGWQMKERSPLSGPAKIFHHHDYCGEIGLIMPYEKNFCASCNRLRVSSNGQLHLCLFGDQGIDLRDLLQNNNQQQALMDRIQTAVKEKRQHHLLHQHQSGIRSNLATIGG